MECVPCVLPKSVDCHFPDAICVALHDNFTYEHSQTDVCGRKVFGCSIS
jgi:hypothetical protein